jgi:hypothetical protein
MAVHLFEIDVCSSDLETFQSLKIAILGSPQEGANACGQFAFAEGFGEVVVGPFIETSNAIVNFTSSGQHHHGCAETALAKFATKDFAAVGFGNLLNQGQTEACTLGFATELGADSIECLEDFFSLTF